MSRRLNPRPVPIDKDTLDYVVDEVINGLIERLDGVKSWNDRRLPFYLVQLPFPQLLRDIHGKNVDVVVYVTVSKYPTQSPKFYQQGLATDPFGTVPATITLELERKQAPQDVLVQALNGWLHQPTADLLVHELRHIVQHKADSADGAEHEAIQTLAKQNEKIGKGENLSPEEAALREASWATYINAPREFEARLGDIVHEVRARRELDLRLAETFRAGKGGKKVFPKGINSIVDIALNNSPTWTALSPYLTEPHRQRVLRAVYQELEPVLREPAKAAPARKRNPLEPGVAPAAPIVIEREVLTERLPALRDQVVHLNTRAARHDFPPMTLEVTGPVVLRSRVLSDGEEVLVPYTPIRLTGTPVRVDGWALSCIIEHEDQIVRSVGDLPCPEKYWKHGIPQHGPCDVCKLSRPRKRTFVLTNEKGASQQIGRECVKDFLRGHPSAENMVGFAAALRDLLETGGGTFDDDPEVAVSAGRYEMTALRVLEIVYDILETPGSTVSLVRSTVANARQQRTRLTTSEAAKTRAQQALAWVKTLDKNESPYFHNLRQIADRGSLAVFGPALPFWVSVPVAYQRAHAVAGKDHVGKVNDRPVLELTVQNIRARETDFGVQIIYTFLDDAGNVLVWRASKPLDIDGKDIEVGQRVRLTCTIKDHGVDQRGNKETTLTRCQLAKAGDEKKKRKVKEDTWHDQVKRLLKRKGHLPQYMGEPNITEKDGSLWWRVGTTYEPKIDQKSPEQIAELDTTTIRRDLASAQLGNVTVLHVSTRPGSSPGVTAIDYVRRIDPWGAPAGGEPRGENPVHRARKANCDAETVGALAVVGAMLPIVPPPGPGDLLTPALIGAAVASRSTNPMTFAHQAKGAPAPEAERVSRAYFLSNADMGPLLSAGQTPEEWLELHPGAEFFRSSWRGRRAVAVYTGGVTYVFADEGQQHRGAGRRGAGILVQAADSGRVLLGRRCSTCTQNGTWGVWGGKIEPGEDALTAARRELGEETGFQGAINVQPLFTFRGDNDFRFETFLGTVPTEFTPTLNGEHEEAGWFPVDQLPEPLHFGVAAILRDQQAAARLASRQENPTHQALSLAEIARWEALAARSGVSDVARSRRGFLTAYKAAKGRLDRLPPAWRAKREAFLARHLAQAKSEALFDEQGLPTRRHLALIMWAYSPAPARLSERRDNHVGGGCELPDGPCDDSFEDAAGGIRTETGLSFAQHAANARHGNPAGVGYKVLYRVGSKLRSKAEARQTMPAKVGHVVRLPGKGVYLSPNRAYVLDYYSDGPGAEYDDPNVEEVLLTLAFDTKDITEGNLTDKESEIAVRSARIVAIEPTRERCQNPKAKVIDVGLSPAELADIRARVAAGNVTDEDMERLIAWWPRAWAATSPHGLRPGWRDSWRKFVPETRTDAEARAELLNVIDTHSHDAIAAKQRSKRAQQKADREEKKYESQGVDLEELSSKGHGAMKRAASGKWVWLYHGTSSTLLPAILERGLLPGENLIDAKTPGVFLTTRPGRGSSGGSAALYAQRAAAHFGGEPVVLRVLVPFDLLEPDPDDEDISAGNHQFVIDAVAPAWIREVNGERVTTRDA